MQVMTGYWTRRASEHRRHAETLRSEAAVTDDPDERGELTRSAIDAGLVAAESCDRNARLYGQPGHTRNIEHDGTLGNEERGSPMTTRDQDEERLSSPLPVDGRKLTAAERLNAVRGLVDRRLESLPTAGSAQPGGELVPPVWKHRPAFVVNVCGGLREILETPETLAAFRRIVEQGTAANVVVFLWEPMDACSAALTAVSGKLAAELAAGHALRHVSEPSRSLP